MWHQDNNLRRLIRDRKLDGEIGRPINVDGSKLAAVLKDPSFKKDQRGIRLKRVNVVGGLDLEDADLPFPLVFERCFFLVDRENIALNLRDCRLYGIRLQGCIFGGHIVAARMRAATKLWLMRSYISGCLDLNYCRIDGAADLRDLWFGLRSCPTPYHELKRNEFQGAAPRLDLEGSKIGGDCFCSNTRIFGRVMFRGAEIDGRLDFSDARLAFDHGREKEEAIFNGDGARLNGRLILSRAVINGLFRAQYSIIRGTVWADVLVCRVENSHGLALDFSGASIGGRFVARWAEISGTLKLVGASITERLILSGAIIQSGRCAINATACRVSSVTLDALDACANSRDIKLLQPWWEERNEGAGLPTPKYASIKGALIFDRAVISGDFSAKDACLVSINPENNNSRQERLALSLRDATLNQLSLPRSRGYGDSKLGQIDLRRCQTTTLDDCGHPVNSDQNSGYAGDRLILSEDHSLLLDGLTYRDIEHPLAGVDDVTTVRIRKWLIPQDSGAEREFSPQPWIQFAEVFKLRGQMDLALDVLIELQRHNRRVKRARIKELQSKCDALSQELRVVADKPELWRDRNDATKRSQKRARQKIRLLKLSTFQDKLLDVFSSYTYRPWRTVVCSAGMVFVCAGLWGWAMWQTCKPESFSSYKIELRGFSVPLLANCNAEGLFVRSSIHSYEKSSYPRLNNLGFSLDVFIPIFDIGYQDTWQVNPDYKQTISISAGRIKTSNEVAMDPYEALEYSNSSTIGEQERRGIAALTITKASVGGLFYLFYLFQVLIGFVLTSLAIVGFAGLVGRSDWLGSREQ